MRAKYGPNELFIPMVGQIAGNTQRVLDYLNRGSDLRSLLDT